MNVTRSHVTCDYESHMRINMAGSVSPVWSNNSGKAAYGAAGHRDVLIIVSEDGLPDPDVVKRRPAIELTEEERGKLENQGIPREDQCDDLSIVKSRYHLDKRRTVIGVEMGQPGGEGLTRESVFKHIATLMNNYDSNGGVQLHYIGHGRRNTGDWCFQDGYITFTDLAQLYLQLLRGRVLTIVTDCSHSGSWVKQCMAFLDQQGVGPCGHSARDKGILIKVLVSCLSHQVPRQLTHSVYGTSNDKNTGDMGFTRCCDSIDLGAKVAEDQHVRGIDSTMVMCGQKSIDDECQCLPGATCQRWSAKKRIYTVRGKDGDRKMWHMTLVVDDDATILQFVEKTQGENRGKLDINVIDYGVILKSGWGEGPSEEEKQSAMQEYRVYQNQY